MANYGTEGREFESLRARLGQPARARRRRRSRGRVCSGVWPSTGEKFRVGGYDVCMATSKPKSGPDPKLAESNGSPATALKRGLPGGEESRKTQRERFTSEHHETLRRLGK